jgi:hypothetical protein
MDFINDSGYQLLGASAKLDQLQRRSFHAANMAVVKAAISIADPLLHLSILQRCE